MCIWLSCVQITSVYAKDFGLISKCYFSFGDSRETLRVWWYLSKLEGRVILSGNCNGASAGRCFGFFSPPVLMVWIILKILLSQIGLVFSHFNLHSYVVDNCVSTVSGKIGKLQPWASGAPQHSRHQALVLGDEERIHCIFHSIAFSRACVRSILAFGLNAHTFISLIVLLHIRSPRYPKGSQSPTLSLLKFMRIFKNLSSSGILSRGQKGGNPLCHHSAPWCQMQPKESRDVTHQDTSQNTLFPTRALCPSRDISTVLVPMDICLCSLFLPSCGMFQDSFWRAECLSWFWVTQCSFCRSTPRV